MTDQQHLRRVALVTGANSGLGFEAARQLADAGYESIVLACRTEAKADSARAALVEVSGVDPFDTLVVDVADLTSSRNAADELIRRGVAFDSVLLNAGMVPTTLARTADGIEMAFASSLVGHHVIATALVDAGLVNDGGVVVLVGSEAGNDDIPGFMGMKVYDFVHGRPSEFGATPAEAMTNFARGTGGPHFNGNRQYSTTKVFSGWWSAAMARRYPGAIRFNTVSPGANASTNATRHATGSFKLVVGFLQRFGRFVGLDHPVEQGARRYLEVLHGDGETFLNGGTYTSRPKKATGPLAHSTPPHLTDVERQDTALDILDQLTQKTTEAP